MHSLHNEDDFEEFLYSVLERMKKYQEFYNQKVNIEKLDFFKMPEFFVGKNVPLCVCNLKNRLFNERITFFINLN